MAALTISSQFEKNISVHKYWHVVCQNESIFIRNRTIKIITCFLLAYKKLCGNYKLISFSKSQDGHRILVNFKYIFNSKYLNGNNINITLKTVPKIPDHKAVILDLQVGNKGAVVFGN